MVEIQPKSTPGLDGLERVLFTINPETKQPDIFVCSGHSKAPGLLNYPEVMNDYVSISDTTTRPYELEQLAAVSKILGYDFKAFIRYR